jgi:oxygen-independent coproporphyrinogen-3 oxidase
VDATEVRSIIDDYVSATDFTRAEVGFRMDADESRRRHLVQSLLQSEGLDPADYRRRFGTDPGADFAAELATLGEAGHLAGVGEAGHLAGVGEAGHLADAPGRLRLSAEGLAYSDAVGPGLFSPAVRRLMAAYEAR